MWGMTGAELVRKNPVFPASCLHIFRLRAAGRLESIKRNASVGIPDDWQSPFVRDRSALLPFLKIGITNAKGPGGLGDHSPIQYCLTHGAYTCRQFVCASRTEWWRI